MTSPSEKTILEGIERATRELVRQRNESKNGLYYSGFAGVDSDGDGVVRIDGDVNLRELVRAILTPMNVGPFVDLSKVIGR
jgi:hypothetical protein